jgi:hypothetical protein
MTKRQQERHLSDLGCTIRQWLKGNEVIIERYQSWGVSLDDLIQEYEKLRIIYNRRWGYLNNGKNNFRTLLAESN